MKAAATAAPMSRMAVLSHEISKSGRFSLWSRPMNRPSAFALLGLYLKLTDSTNIEDRKSVV